MREVREDSMVERLGVSCRIRRGRQSEECEFSVATVPRLWEGDKGPRNSSSARSFSCSVYVSGVSGLLALAYMLLF